MTRFGKKCSFLYRRCISEPPPPLPKLSSPSSLPLSTLVNLARNAQKFGKILFKKSAVRNFKVEKRQKLKKFGFIKIQPNFVRNFYHAAGAPL